MTQTSCWNIYYKVILNYVLKAFQPIFKNWHIIKLTFLCDSSMNTNIYMALWTSTKIKIINSAIISPQTLYCSFVVTSWPPLPKYWQQGLFLYLVLFFQEYHINGIISIHFNLLRLVFFHLACFWSSPTFLFFSFLLPSGIPLHDAPVYPCTHWRTLGLFPVFCYE